jgi:hypothetical protein
MPIFNVTAMRIVAMMIALVGPVLIASAIYIYRNPRFG